MPRARMQRPIEYRDGKERVWSVSVDRLFAEAEPTDAVDSDRPPAAPQKPQGTGVGPAPPETVALWVKLVATMGPDELADFEERTSRQWDRASLGDLCRAIERRRNELAS